MSNSNSNALSVFSYQGNKITFQNNGNVMVNATQMAKSFKKRPAKWLELPSTKEFIEKLSEVRKSDITLVETIKGVFKDGRQQGTWFHEDVALEFARWLSPTFAIWCNDRIKELLTQGVTTVSNDDEVIAQAMNVLQRRLDASRQKVQMLESTVEVQETEIKTLAPKAEYTDEVLQSTSTFTTTQIAKDLGISAITLNKKLKESGIQFYQSGQWFLYSGYQDKGYTDMRISKYVNRHTGKVETQQSMVWTEKGRQFIHQLQKGGTI